jgi:hypothetical protein
MLEAMFPSPPICMLLHGPGVMFPPTHPLLFTALLEFEDFGLLGRVALCSGVGPLLGSPSRGAVALWGSGLDAATASCFGSDSEYLSTALNQTGRAIAHTTRQQTTHKKKYPLQTWPKNHLPYTQVNQSTGFHIQHPKRKFRAFLYSPEQIRESLRTIRLSDVFRP